MPPPALTPCLPDGLLDLARALPKVLLHEHLDGGLREATLLELLAARGLPAPAADVPSLAGWFDDRAQAGSLVEYLKGFDLTVAAMASPEALERVAFEAAEDARLDGCVLAEFRIAPLLFEPFGIPGDEAMRAMLSGLARSPLPSGLIVCALRHERDAQIERAAELALRWHGRGVIAFDLAGPEAGWPATRHADLLARLCEAGLPLTLHAGEAAVLGYISLERVAPLLREFRVGLHQLHGRRCEVAAVDEEVGVGGEEGEHGVASAAAHFQQSCGCAVRDE
jgi:adenosine deaminase